MAHAAAYALLQMSALMLIDQPARTRSECLVPAHDFGSFPQWGFGEVRIALGAEEDTYRMNFTCKAWFLAIALHLDALLRAEIGRSLRLLVDGFTRCLAELQSSSVVASVLARW